MSDFDPNALPGDDPYQFASLAPDPGGDTQTLTYTDTDYTADDVFGILTCTLREFKAKLGPLPVAVSYNEGGAAVLTVSNLPAPLPAPFAATAASALFTGAVNGQPYDVVVPVTLGDGTGTVDPDPGSGGADLLDLGIALGMALTDIGAARSVLSGGAGFVHALVTATANDTGDTLDLVEVGAVVKIAISSRTPNAEDYQSGDWLTRTAGAAGGTYARLDVSLLGLARGAYWVYVQVIIGDQVFVRRCPGRLTVTL